jgi:hypothetical protein
MSVNFDETQSVTQELTKVYQNLDDEESISQLQKQRADIQRAQEKKETEQKKLIKGNFFSPFRIQNIRLMMNDDDDALRFC